LLPHQHGSLAVGSTSGMVDIALKVTPLTGNSELPSVLSPTTHGARISPSSHE
jgi:hypothetical protein